MPLELIFNHPWVLKFQIKYQIGQVTEDESKSQISACDFDSSPKIQFLKKSIVAMHKEDALRYLSSIARKTTTDNEMCSPLDSYIEECKNNTPVGASTDRGTFRKISVQNVD